MEPPWLISAVPMVHSGENDEVLMPGKEPHFPYIRDRRQVCSIHFLADSSKGNSDFITFTDKTCNFGRVRLSIDLWVKSTIVITTFIVMK